MRLEPIFAFGFATLAMAWIGASSAQAQDSPPPNPSSRTLSLEYSGAAPGTPADPVAGVHSTGDGHAVAPSSQGLDARRIKSRSALRSSSIPSTAGRCPFDAGPGRSLRPRPPVPRWHPNKGRFPGVWAVGRECVRPRIPSIRHMASPNAGSSNSMALRKTPTYRRPSRERCPRPRPVPALERSEAPGRPRAPRPDRAAPLCRGLAARSGEKARAEVRPHRRRRRPTWVRRARVPRPRPVRVPARDSRARSRRVRLRSP